MLFLGVEQASLIKVLYTKAPVGAPCSSFPTFILSSMNAPSSLSFPKKSPLTRMPDPNVESFDAGVWRAHRLLPTKGSASSTWQKVWESAPAFLRLSTELFNVNPSLFLVFVLSKLWMSWTYSHTITMYLSSRVLQEVRTLIRHPPFVVKICQIEARRHDTATPPQFRNDTTLYTLCAFLVWLVSSEIITRIAYVFLWAS